MDIVSYSMEVINHPNYLIYEDGRVYNQKYNRFLKSSLDRGGYKHILLSNNGKRKCFLIHRLIGLHYIPNPNNKYCIDHIDRNRTNNDISNLRWVTHTENMNNKSKQNNNKSGYTNISWDKRSNKWRYTTQYTSRLFKSKIDCICYKYIMILRHKV